MSRDEAGVTGADGESGPPPPEEAIGRPDAGRRWSPGDLGALGDRPWVVLGGGGLRGLSHVGAWQALEEAGVAPSGIIGCSIGALIGACVAGGMGWKELVPLAFALRKEDIIRINRRAVWINGIRQESLFQGDPLRDYIRRVLPVRGWSELSIPLQVNALDLDTGTPRWFGTGVDTDVDLAEAVYASAALPVFYPPARIGDGVYVDAGAADGFPLRRVGAVDASGVIGIDVGAGPAAHPHQFLEQGMLAIHQRLFSIISWRWRRALVERWTDPPLLFVRPELDDFGTFAFGEIRYFLEEGYRATRVALMQGL